MRELQQLKRVRLEQDVDQEVDSNPLSLVIQAKMVPPTIRVFEEKFNGISYLTDHVAIFESHMDLYGGTDAAKCRAFLTTFRGVARSWYNSLPAQSITKFKYFKKLFISHFMAHKRRPKKMTSLWLIAQGLNETLEKYTERFTKAYSCVTNPNKEFAIQAYIAGIANASVQLPYVAMM